MISPSHSASLPLFARVRQHAARRRRFDQRFEMRVDRVLLLADRGERALVGIRIQHRHRVALGHRRALAQQDAALARRFGDQPLAAHHDRLALDLGIDRHRVEAADVARNLAQQVDRSRHKCHQQCEADEQKQEKPSVCFVCPFHAPFLYAVSRPVRFVPTMRARPFQATRTAFHFFRRHSTTARSAQAARAPCSVPLLL